MGKLDEFKAIQSEISDAKRPKRQQPEGWEPGITWNGNEGTITTAGGPIDQAADWSAGKTENGYQILLKENSQDMLR